MAKKKKTWPATRLETERLILKPISPFQFARQTFYWTTDKQALADLNMPPSGWTFLKWWKQLRKLNRKRRMTHGIWPKGQDKPIGLHMVSFPPPAGEAITAIFIGDKAWRGKGIAVEVKQAVIADLFGRCGVYRVTSWVNARNFASLHMTMRLGFKQEAQMREQAVLLDGSRADFLGFGMLRREWNTGGDEPVTKDDI